MIKKILLLMGLVSLLGCRSDLLTINSDQKELLKKTANSHKRFSTTFLSENMLEQELKNRTLKAELKKSIHKAVQNESGASKTRNYNIYQKIFDSLKESTTYSLTLIEYSERHPYFLKHIITVKDGRESMGFLKIIPTSKPGLNKEVLYHLSGVIQILDYNMNIRAEDSFLNGKPHNTNKNSSNSNTRKSGCTTSLSIVSVNCSAGGNHSPGEVCSGNASEQPYYEIISTTSCTGPVNEYLSAPDNPVVNGGGGGGANTITLLLNNPKFNFSSYLLNSNKMDLLNFVANYIAINDPYSIYNNDINFETVSHLNQILSVFENRTDLFDNFDILQNLLADSKFYLEDSARYYDTRIYNLIKYLFEHPTEANANFVSWATQFYVQNTLPNGTCTVTWTQFEDWFLTDTPEGFMAKLIQENPLTILNYETLSSPEFKMRKLDQIKYPKFTNTVIMIANYVNSNTKVMQTLKQFTGLNDQQILDKLKFGKGPLLEIIDIPGAYGYHNPITNIVQIDVNYIKKLENSTGANAEIMNIFLSITLLHEFIHWTDGLFFNWTQESGATWEIATYGFVVDTENVKLIKN